jgi:hypothetical protein
MAQDAKIMSPCLSKILRQLGGTRRQEISSLVNSSPSAFPGSPKSSQFRKVFLTGVRLPAENQITGCFLLFVFYLDLELFLELY